MEMETTTASTIGTTSTTATTPPTPTPTTPTITSPTAIAGPLGYADGSSAAALPAHVRATPLLAPNLIALLVLFLPQLDGKSPLGPVFQYATQLIRTRGQPSSNVTWEAMITGPFLLAVPLALWTLRLSLAPRPRPAERAIAWSVTLASSAMTILCLGYCTALGPRRFWAPIVMAILVLAAASCGVAALWQLRRAWPTALIAMTGAWAVNATLAICVLLTHARWTVGIEAGLLAIVLQLIIGFACVRRWRVQVPVA
jgi:hypothetical protein